MISLWGFRRLPRLLCGASRNVLPQFILQSVTMMVIIVLMIIITVRLLEDSGRQECCLPCVLQDC